MSDRGHPHENELFGPPPNDEELGHQAGVVLLTSRPLANDTPWLGIPGHDVLLAELEHGVSHVLAKYASDENAERAARRSIYGVSRAPWQVLCDVNPNSVILEFGCGLGVASRVMAKRCRAVLGIDTHFDRLLLNAAVNREQGVSNVRLAYGTHKELRRVKNACVDGIVLDGVLPGIPEHDPGAPLAVQRAFLAECRRVLKPDGWLYLGVQNRWSFQRLFLGDPDDDSGLRYVGLMPRWLANVYRRARGRRSDGTWTYGPGAYRSLLASAGLPQRDLYATAVDYRGHSLLIPLPRVGRVDGAADHFGVVRRWKKRVVESPRFLGRFAPSLGIIAQTAASVPPWLEDLRLAGSSLQHIHTNTGGSSGNEQASIWYRTAGGALRIREVAFTEDGIRTLQRIASLRSSIPQLRATTQCLNDWRLFEHNGTCWVDRAFVGGQTLAKLPAGQRGEHMPGVCQALRQLSDIPIPQHLKPRGVRQLFDDYLGDGAGELPREMLDELRRLASQLDQTRRRRTSLMHGDCTPPNVIVDTAGATQFIDWEWSRVVTFSGFDILHLLWRGVAIPGATSPGREANYIAASLKDDDARHLFGEVHPHDSWPNSVFAFWLLRIAREARAGAPRHWLAQMGGEATRIIGGHA